MIYLIVGAALLAALFFFIEARLRSPRMAKLAGRRAAHRRHRRPVQPGRADLRLLAPLRQDKERRAQG